MQNSDEEHKTVITVDLDIKTIEWAEILGLDLSEMADKFLKIEVDKRLKELADAKSTTIYLA